MQQGDHPGERSTDLDLCRIFFFSYPFVQYPEIEVCWREYCNRKRIDSALRECIVSSCSTPSIRGWRQPGRHDKSVTVWNATSVAGSSRRRGLHVELRLDATTIDHRHHRADDPATGSKPASHADHQRLSLPSHPLY